MRRLGSVTTPAAPLRSRDLAPTASQAPFKYPKKKNKKKQVPLEKTYFCISVFSVIFCRLFIFIFFILSLSTMIPGFVSFWFACMSSFTGREAAFLWMCPGSVAAAARARVALKPALPFALFGLFLVLLYLCLLS